VGIARKRDRFSLIGAKAPGTPILRAPCESGSPLSLLTGGEDGWNAKNSTNLNRVAHPFGFIERVGYLAKRDRFSLVEAEATGAPSFARSPEATHSIAFCWRNYFFSRFPPKNRMSSPQTT
jgi:hypothetical protein